jgi:hypothetical protein
MTLSMRRSFSSRGVERAQQDRHARGRAGGELHADRQRARELFAPRLAACHPALHHRAGLGHRAEGTEEVAPAAAPLDHVAVGREERVVAPVGPLVGRVETEHGAAPGVERAAQVGVGAGEGGIAAQQPFDVGRQPEVALAGALVREGVLPDLHRFVRGQEDPAAGADAVMPHLEARVAEADPGGEGGPGRVDRKQPRVPHLARRVVPEVRVAAAIPDQADPSAGMVEHQGLVVEHPVAAAELVQPGYQRVVPEEVDLRPRRSQGIRDDILEAVVREVSVVAHDVCLLPGSRVASRIPPADRRAAGTFPVEGTRSRRRPPSSTWPKKRTKRCYR